MYNKHMHVILTHEQADFDAVASLLGAHLLDEKAVPVLPRRMNRNVRAFITLYGLDLPFVDPRDLPKGKIETVTLVDSQSLVTLKGMSKATKVYVLDHHQRRSDLPRDWQVTTEDIGATATLLVEAMQERGVSLTVPQATLLLLGIYEDTGGLTYVRTTPRDLRAAAYLVEQGANMQILGDFLNHPLSKEQQALYDSLREDVETHLINGNMVMVGDRYFATLEVVHMLPDNPATGQYDPDYYITLSAPPAEFGVLPDTLLLEAGVTRIFHLADSFRLAGGRDTSGNVDFHALGDQFSFCSGGAGCEGGVFVY